MADRKKHVLSKVVKKIIFQNITLLVMFYRALESTRPKTKSAQNQLGPALDYEILLLSSSLSSFLLLSFSSSFIVCIMPWEFISLKEVS